MPGLLGIDTRKDTDMNTDTHGKLLYGALTYKIRGVFFNIRKIYGPGQKEVIYHRLIREGLESLGLTVEQEKKVYIYSQETWKKIGAYQPDLLIEDKVLIEVKSSRFTSVTDEKQLYYYLRNSMYEVGFLVNFSTPKLFIKRIIYTNDRKPYICV